MLHGQTILTTTTRFRSFLKASYVHTESRDQVSACPRYITVLIEETVLCSEILFWAPMVRHVSVSNGNGKHG